MFIIQIRSTTKFLGSYILWSVVSMKSIYLKFKAIQWCLKQLIHSVHCRKYSCILAGLQSKNEEAEFPLKHDLTFWSKAHTTYILPTALNWIFKLLHFQIPVQLILWYYSLLYPTHFEGELSVLTEMVFGVVASTGRYAASPQMHSIDPSWATE